MVRLWIPAAAVLALGGAVFGVYEWRRWAETRAAVEALIAEGESLLAEDAAKGKEGDRDLRSRASTKFSDALRLDPSSSRAWRGLGRVHYASRKFTEALGDYEKALRDPSAPASWHREAGDAAYVLFHDHSGSPDDFVLAASHYERALAIDPSNREALKYLGSLMEARGDRERRDECWRRLLEVAPDWEGTAEVRAFLEKESEKAAAPR